MDKVSEIAMLLDFYGSLLTQKQQLIMSYHYESDMSLSEISEELKTSRQAAHDIIKRSEKILLEYEEKLQLIKKFEIQKNKLLQIKSMVIENSSNKDINKIIEMLDELIYM